MKRFKLSVSNNPSFNSVTGLTNTTFDPTTMVSGRGATEDQVKVVYDRIKELQDWLDENGCSDDPYAIIKQKVDELEAAIDQCCANPQDTIVQMLTARLDALEARIDEGCIDCEEQVQRIVSDILRENRNEDIIIPQTCDEEVTINYTVDISQETEVTSEGKVVGNVTAVAETGTNIIRYLFYFLVNNLAQRDTEFTWIGHDNIVFELEHSTGNIIMRKRWQVQQGQSITQIENVYTVGEGTVIPNIYVEALTEKGCVVRKELLSSDFDFSGIDGNTP